MAQNYAKGQNFTGVIAPTKQTFITGSGTYTTPANVKWIRVRMVGAGGGGQGNSTAGTIVTTATAGGDTTFGGLTAGGGGVTTSTNWSNAPGGIVSGSIPGVTANAITGGDGGGGQQKDNTAFGQLPGGHGGGSFFGGGGSSLLAANTSTGIAYGSGGGGGGTSSSSGYVSGSGGGAGAYAEFVIDNPDATYSYGIGAGGGGGAGQSLDGANGAGGLIIVEEFYEPQSYARPLALPLIASNGGWGVSSVILNPQGRLTLTSGTPVTTSDVTAATTLYYTPFVGNLIPLYNGSNWALSQFSELSIAVPATTNTLYDVFIYDNAGTLTLELVAWTNDTTRATTLSRQDGLLVKTGDATRLYVGSFRTTGTSGQTEDSAVKRYCWNTFNRVTKRMQRVDTTNSWTYSTATQRYANGDGANQLDVVRGLNEDAVYIYLAAAVYSSTATTRTVNCGIGQGAVSISNLCNRPRLVASSAKDEVFGCAATFMPTQGRQYFPWVESGAGTDTQTWYGVQSGQARSGLTGHTRC